MCLFTCMHVCTFREWQCGNEGGCQRRGWYWCAVTRDLLKVWSASCLFRPTTQAFKNNSATACDMQPIYLYNTFNVSWREALHRSKQNPEKRMLPKREQFQVVAFLIYRGHNMWNLWDDKNVNLKCQHWKMHISMSLFCRYNEIISACEDGLKCRLLIHQVFKMQINCRPCEKLFPNIYWITCES